MTTQSPRLYSRPPEAGSAAPPAPPVRKAAGAQTRLPWWAVALPAVAFAALLALIGGGSAGASAPAGGADLVARIATTLGVLLHRLV